MEGRTREDKMIKGKLYPLNTSLFILSTTFLNISHSFHGVELLNVMEKVMSEVHI